MARTLTQIQKELATGDAAQRKLINEQLAALPKQFQGQRQGLEAQQRQAFGNILSGAKQRGLKFSGIPLAEQAEFTSTQFLPALAQLEQQRNTQRAGLQGALADILAQRMAQAQSIRQTELNRDLQREQAEASRRAASRAAAQQSSLNSVISSLFGGGGKTPSGETLSTQNFADSEKMRALQADAAEYADRLEKSITDNESRLRIFQGLLNRAQNKDIDKFTQAEARFKAGLLAERFGFELPGSVLGQIRSLADQGFDVAQRKQGNQTILTGTPRF